MTSQKKSFVDILQPFVIGGLSGITATCVVQPIDMIKVTIQLKSEEISNMKAQGKKVENQSVSPIQIFKQIKNQPGGFRNFYRGFYIFQLELTQLQLDKFFILQQGQEFIKQFLRKQRRIIMEVLLKLLENLSLFQKAYCSLFAGFIGSLVGNPADLILVRMQADSRLPIQQRRNYKNIFDAFKTISMNQGVLALWRGCVPTVIRAMVLNLAMLSSYDEVKDQLNKLSQNKDSQVIRLTASAVSGLLSSASALPFDNAKTKIQKMVKNPDGSMPYKNIFDAMIKTVRKQGFLGLWVGFPTFYIRIAPHVMITLIVQDYLTDKANKVRKLGKQ